MPLVRRIPKRGFHNRWAVVVAVVNVRDLENAFASGDEVTLDALAAKNLARGNFHELKVLGAGELTKPLTVAAHRFSRTAAEKITQAGGKVVVVAGKTPAREKQQAAAARR